ncbi:transglycosylase SLT domain-containing protein [Lentisalinibacter sediminis]|uniref:transglycosylase SLT domain-containing protein n=1 Tax=Lentisalinibacter sediminis TaxID=2992237 RepID=UPI00386AC78F
MHDSRALPFSFPAVAALGALAVMTVMAAMAAIAGGPPSAADDIDIDNIEARRELFAAVYAEAREGEWASAEAAAAELRDYPLWPDLRAAWLQATIRHADSAQVEAFLREHAHLPPARRLADRWIHELARRGDWSRFLTLYSGRYADAGITTLDCTAAEARSLTEAGHRYTENDVERLWLAGRSQPRECDPVFEAMRAQGLLDAERYRQRFALAIDAREFRLARYLARELDEDARREAAAWIAMQNDPAAELVRLDPAGVNETVRARALWGVEALARRDPAYAAELWRRLASQLHVSGRERWEVAGYIGIRAALRREPAAPGLLKAIPAHLASADVLAWRTRDALRREDWPDVLAAIEAMPADMAGQDIWRYWRARGLAATGEQAAAESLWRALAAERSYHGFLAADALDLPYAFGHAPLPADGETLAGLARDPAIQRASELFLVGLESLGRSEWNEAVTGLDNHRLAQAALLAHRWGWHSRAIATAAKAGHYDDLGLRYPLPWKTDFETHAAAADIREAWAYGIARSESLFMADIRSSAGAIGVMQLMPATGRGTAQRARLRWRGYATLIDPPANIQLGTRYLAEVYERFDANPVLATAAYNAGPHRVERWLPEARSLPADIWIETIPFAETRSYVKRVLTADSIFSWRLTGRELRLSALHPPVAPPGERLALARAGDSGR